MLSKIKLRKYFLELRQTFSDEYINSASNQISKRLLNLDFLNDNKNFLIYHSFGKEINTLDIIVSLLEKKKNVFLPYISDDKKELEIAPVKNLNTGLITGVWGIKEPFNRDNAPLEKIDIIIVPGLLFSRKGFRIGYGGGYYDKLLARKSEDTITIGLAFSDFIFNDLPVNDYDMPVDFILTEKETIEIGGKDQ